MKQPCAAGNSLVQQAQAARDGELGGEAQKWKRLIQIPMDDREKLCGVRQGGMVDQHVIEYETPVVAADKPTSKRG